VPEDDRISYTCDVRLQFGLSWRILSKEECHFREWCSSWLKIWRDSWASSFPPFTAKLSTFNVDCLCYETRAFINTRNHNCLLTQYQLRLLFHTASSFVHQWVVCGKSLCVLLTQQTINKHIIFDGRRSSVGYQVKIEYIHTVFIQMSREFPNGLIWILNEECSTETAQNFLCFWLQPLLIFSQLVYTGVQVVGTDHPIFGLRYLLIDFAFLLIHLHHSTVLV